MTPIVLLECLEEFVKDKTKDIMLQVRVRNQNPDEEKERAAGVYKMRLPNKEDQTQKIPYILLQVLKGEDKKEERGPQESTCQIRIIVATYSEDGGTGSFDVLNVLMRLKSELEKVGIIGNRFTLQLPLEWIVYPDTTQPYYLGEMMTNWELPVIKREVEEIWQ